MPDDSPEAWVMSTMALTTAANLGDTQLVDQLLEIHWLGFIGHEEDWRVLSFLALHCALTWKFFTLPYESPFVAYDNEQVEATAIERAGLRLMVNVANLIQDGDHHGLVELKARTVGDADTVRYATRLAAITLGRIVHRAHLAQLQPDT